SGGIFGLLGAQLFLLYSRYRSSNPRAHADFIDVDTFLSFLKKIKGSVPQIDCMIEAKMKDESLFQLMRDLSEQTDVEIIDGASFYIK
ncbi:hypothetical protein ACT4UT_05480, partial [Bacillus sp. B-TM1]